MEGKVHIVTCGVSSQTQEIVHALTDCMQSGYWLVMQNAHLADDYACIDYQADYTNELIADTDYPSFDIEAASKAFYAWKKHKKKNIMTFRDNGYASPMTGTMAPAHHTVWKDAPDDSLEDYLKV